MSLLLAAALLMQQAQQDHSRVILVPAQKVLHQVRTAHVTISALSAA